MDSYSSRVLRDRMVIDGSKRGQESFKYLWYRAERLWLSWDAVRRGGVHSCHRYGACCWWPRQTSVRIGTRWQATGYAERVAACLGLHVSQSYEKAQGALVTWSARRRRCHGKDSIGSGGEQDYLFFCYPRCCISDGTVVSSIVVSV
jgi:hypothetical protein